MYRWFLPEPPHGRMRWLRNWSDDVFGAAWCPHLVRSPFFSPFATHLESPQRGQLHAANFRPRYCVHPVREHQSEDLLSAQHQLRNELVRSFPVLGLPPPLLNFDPLLLQHGRSYSQRHYWPVPVDVLSPRTRAIPTPSHPSISLPIPPFKTCTSSRFGDTAICIWLLRAPERSQRAERPPCEEESSRCMLKRSKA